MTKYLNKRFSKLIIKFFVVLLLLLIMSSCDDKETVKSEWTILVYMAADNGLNQSAINDINQMENAFISDSINVIVQIDFNEEDVANSQYENVVRYQITHDETEDINSTILMNLRDINSGKPENLVDFVNWGLSKYPSERVGLIIWSHGTGWRENQNRYICQDGVETISVADGELRNAFNQFNSYLDFVMFDACNMQSIEIITEIEGYTSCIIGSEDAIPTMGFPYNDIFNNWQVDYSTIDICKMICSDYYNSYFPGGSQNPHGLSYRISMSAFDTQYYESLYDKLDMFGEKWKNQITKNFSIAREECYEFNTMQMDIDIQNYFTELRDLSFDNQELQQDIDTILASLSATILYENQFNYPSLVGTISFWFPSTQIEYDNTIELYNNLRFSDNNFLHLIEKIISQN